MRRGLVRDTLQHGLGRGPSSETRFLPFNIQRHSFNSYKLKAYCVREEPRACPGVGTSPDGIFLVARPRTHRIAEQSPGLSQVSLCDLWQGVAALWAALAFLPWTPSAPDVDSDLISPQGVLFPAAAASSQLLLAAGQLPRPARPA